MRPAPPRGQVGARRILARFRRSIPARHAPPRHGAHVTRLSGGSAGACSRACMRPGPQRRPRPRRPAPPRPLRPAHACPEVGGAGRGGQEGGGEAPNPVAVAVPYIQHHHILPREGTATPPWIKVRSSPYWHRITSAATCRESYVGSRRSRSGLVVRRHCGCLTERKKGLDDWNTGTALHCTGLGWLTVTVGLGGRTEHSINSGTPPCQCPGSSQSVDVGRHRASPIRLRTCTRSLDPLARRKRG